MTRPNNWCGTKRPKIMNNVVQKIVRFGNRKIYYFLIIFYLFFVSAIIIVSRENLPGGFRFFTNRFISMRPLINSGSLTVVKKQPYYIEGDIITYYAQSNNKEEIVTHRIYRIGGNVYLTKGDNNVAVDEYKVLPRLIIGQVIAIIPNVGYIFSFAKSPIGVILLIIFPAVLFIGCEVIKVLFFLR